MVVKLSFEFFKFVLLLVEQGKVKSVKIIINMWPNELNAFGIQKRRLVNTPHNNSYFHEPASERTNGHIA